MDYQEAKRVAKKAAPAPSDKRPPLRLEDFHSVADFFRSLSSRKIYCSIHHIPEDGMWVSELKLFTHGTELQGRGSAKSGDAALNKARMAFNRELKELTKKWKRSRRKK